MRKFTAMVLVVFAGFGLAGCGDDDDDSSSPAGSEESTEDSSEETTDESAEDESSESASGGGGGDVKKYCEISNKLDDAFPEDAEAETPEEIAAVFKKFIDDHADEFEQMKNAAPNDIRPEVEAALAVFDDVAGGDLSGLEDFDTTKVDDFEEENC